MDEVVKKIPRVELINLILRDEDNILEDDYSWLYKRKELNNWTTDKLLDECKERGLVHEADEAERDRVIKTNTNRGVKI